MGEVTFKSKMTRDLSQSESQMSFEKQEDSDSNPIVSRLTKTVLKPKHHNYHTIITIITKIPL